MTETDAEFVADMEWLHSHDREAVLPPEKLSRLFALARRGAAMDEAHAVGFRDGAAHMHKAQAARIERLEAALEVCDRVLHFDLRGMITWGKDYNQAVKDAADAARAALEDRT